MTLKTYTDQELFDELQARQKAFDAKKNLFNDASDVRKKYYQTYDFMDMNKVIDNKLGYNARKAGKHFHPETGDYNDWHKEKGLRDYDIEGNHKGSSKILFSQYKKDVEDGKWLETPYMDFWHWQLANCVSDNFRNDNVASVYIGEDYSYIIAEPWQKEIQKVWHDTFKHLADEDDTIDIWVSW